MSHQKAVEEQSPNLRTPETPSPAVCGGPPSLFDTVNGLGVGQGPSSSQDPGWEFVLFVIH
jgi:hypothetical protein